MKSITRDQARTEKALGALDEVVRKYPGSEYAVSAKQKIEVARDQLAGKEMEITTASMKKKDYTGAINRFKVVVTKFQTTRHVEKAPMRLTESYMALGIVDEAQTAAVVLAQFPTAPGITRLRAGEDQRRRAEGKSGFLDQQGLQTHRLGLRARFTHIVLAGLVPATVVFTAESQEACPAPTGRGHSRIVRPCSPDFRSATSF